MVHFRPWNACITLDTGIGNYRLRHPLYTSCIDDFNAMADNESSEDSFQVPISTARI